MSNLKDQVEIDKSDDAENNLEVTVTQIASCVVGAEFVEHRRQSLRAKLERELYERKKNGPHSIFNTICNLLGLTRKHG